ncbi:MAG: hypothetical protein K2W95_28635 [Candidatus Obscuribacterales bacterium]|nr:hypothetical protein [Candidatus Obscuribacterales bacterium]
MDLHIADQTLTLVAGVSFILCYIVGLAIGRSPRASVVPAVILCLLCVLLRGMSAPLSFHAIYAVSAIHFGIGILTTKILVGTRPLGYKPESLPTDTTKVG